MGIQKNIKKFRANKADDLDQNWKKKNKDKFLRNRRKTRDTEKTYNERE
jgi:hypothetical protein